MRLLALVAASILIVPASSAESAVALAERFALADDREAVVASLVPGTDDHFYYRALSWQHQGRLAEVDALLPRWEDLHPHSSRVARIRLRQAVLWVDRDAVVGAQRLADAAGLDLDLKAGAEPAPAAAPRLPSVLDPRLYAPEALIAKAEANGRLDGWSQTGLQHRVVTLKGDALRRAALERITDRDFPGRFDVVLADLKAPGGDFGSSPLHDTLTVAELDALRAAQPALSEDLDFLEAVIRARRSRIDLDRLVGDDAQRQAWIAGLREFAAPLPKVAEPLQAFVALHHLREQVRAGRVTMPEVAAVLRLPLVAGPQDTAAIDEQTGKPRAVDPGNRLLLATGLKPIAQPAELIDEALLAVLRTAPDTSGLAGLRDEETLRQRFIEAKLLGGIGEATTWLKRPEDVVFGRAVQERVELRFADAAPERLAADAEVVLPLVLKQVPTLRVRIFALDAVNLYRQDGAEPGTGLDLAGVVPTHERVLTFAQPPIIRHQHALALPECAGPGLWLVELIGGHQVARAVIRKGALSFSRTLRADGEHLHLVDEADRPVPAAAVWIGEQRFTAGPDGSVRLPYVVEPRSDTLVLSGAGRTAVVRHERRTEGWSLHAGMLLEREQLIAGGQATMLLRPRLRLLGHEQPFSHARDVRVEVTTTTGNGMRRVTTVVPQGDPAQADWRVTFPCDEGVVTVETRVFATVHNRSLGADQHLDVTQSMALNGEILTGRLYDAYLEATPTGWSLALLGRAGEPLIDEPLELSLTHVWLNDPLVVRLATDTTGRVHLGALPGFTQVRWVRPQLARYGYDGVPTGSHHVERRWDLHHHSDLPDEITIPAGETLRLPLVRQPGQAIPRWSLWRGDGEVFAEDVSSLATLEDQRGVPVLVIPALAAGRYRVRASSRETTVRVVAGPRQGDLVFSAGAIHRVDPATPLGVAVLPQGDGVRIQVAGRTPSTRVQVFGLRFHPAVMASFPAVEDPARGWWPRAWPATHYQQGRPLDPELGYILARADAPRLPGVMLERPGLILTPWIDDTFVAAGAGDGSAGMFGNRHGGGSRRALSKGGGMDAALGSTARNVVLDFLSGPGVALTNLMPDADGAVVLTAARLGDSRVLMVQAGDATQQAGTVAALARGELARRERRLMNGLPVDQHLVVQRRAQALPAGGRAVVRRSALDRSRLCASVQDLLRLHQALTPELQLQTFEALGRWATLDDAARKRWYSAHACHEVHLFLWHKDRAFFDAVVRPYLANKLQPDFIDQWLLERDLTPWLSADRHAALNLCERILLARRLGGVPGAQELASLQAEVFADLPDERSELGERIAALLVAHGEGTVVGRVRQEPEMELPPMKVTSIERSVNVAQAENADINAPVQDYRDHARSGVVFERRWYHVPADRSHQSARFSPSGFWRDLAAWDGTTGFLPASCLLARELHEVLLTLALCDLPLTAGEARWSETPDQRQVEVATPALLLSEEIVPHALQAGAVVVQQRHHLAEAVRAHDDQAPAHVGAFTAGTMYVTRSVVLNPTPQPLTVAVLAQIPTGAIPLLGLPATFIGEMEIRPYGHTQVLHAFYFPQDGAFVQYPTHVQSGTGVYAATVDTHCQVGGPAGATTGGTQSTPPAVLLGHLATRPRYEIDFDALRWRFADAEFWRSCVAICEQRRWYEDAVWSASLRHRDTARMAVWLRTQRSLVERLGRTVHSTWLTIEALDDGGVVHADITPLTIARAHRRPGMANDLPQQVVERWYRLLERMCLVPRLSARDRLEIAYTLTLQDRLAEASLQFARITRDDLAARLQYDYLGAYLALGRGDLAAAAQFAASGKDHPVEHWRLRFGEVLAQLDEIAGRPAVREAALGAARRQEIQAATTPTFQARLIADGAVAISATNLERCTIRWHRLDLEPLFSQAPFAIATAARSTRVRAPVEQEVVIPATGQAEVAMPAALQHQAVAIEVSAAGRSQVLTTFADALDVRLAPGSGQLQVLHAATGKPLPATYVKVYGELPDGRVVFHKDGYTDLRGRFDYASRGDGTVRAGKRLALFISHDQAGATVREVLPP